MGFGRWTEARQLLDVATTAGNDLQLLRLAQYFAAELDLLEGSPESARSRLEPLVTEGACGYDHDLALPTAHLAWAHAALGNAARATTLADRAVAQARRIESRMSLVEALRAKGTASIELQQWETAEQTLGDALILAREMDFGWREAIILLLQARLHARLGHTEAAQACFSQGREIFRRLGGEEAATRAEAYAGPIQSR